MKILRGFTWKSYHFSDADFTNDSSCSSGPSLCSADICQPEISALKRKPALLRIVEKVHHYWLFQTVPSDFTGTLGGNRHYPTRPKEGPLLLCSNILRCNASRLYCGYPGRNFRPSKHDFFKPTRTSKVRPLSHITYPNHMACH